VDDKIQAPEMIEQQIQDTRESITDKVAMLEQTVVGTFQNATDAVQDTVTTVKDAVKDSVDAVKDSVQQSVTSVTDSVKETLDISKHVRQHPWQMLAGAALAGLAAGWLFSSRRAATRAAAQAENPLRELPQAAPAYSSTPSKPREPGVVDAVLGKVGHEVQGLIETTLDTTFTTLREQMRENWPKVVATLVTAATDRVAEATSLGVPETSSRFENRRVASTFR